MRLPGTSFLRIAATTSSSVRSAAWAQTDLTFRTFAAYLPELFPTRFRASGQGFCWNSARCATAIGPLIGGVLVGAFGSFPAAAVSTSVFYIIGMGAIWFGPETKGVPLSD